MQFITHVIRLNFQNSFEASSWFCIRECPVPYIPHLRHTELLAFFPKSSLKFLLSQNSHIVSAKMICSSDVISAYIRILEMQFKKIFHIWLIKVLYILCMYNMFSCRYPVQMISAHILASFIFSLQKHCLSFHWSLFLK